RTNRRRPPATHPPLRTARQRRTRRPHRRPTRLPQLLHPRPPATRHRQREQEGPLLSPPQATVPPADAAQHRGRISIRSDSPAIPSSPRAKQVPRDRLLARDALFAASVTVERCRSGPRGAATASSIRATKGRVVGEVPVGPSRAERGRASVLGSDVARVLR